MAASKAQNYKARSTTTAATSQLLLYRHAPEKTSSHTGLFQPAQLSSFIYGRGIAQLGASSTPAPGSLT